VTTVQVTKQAAPLDVSAFETRDFYLACFLRCTGYPLINLRPEGRHKVFVFEDRPARPADVIAFYGDRTTVPPLAFSSTVKDMKALLYNA
jgi:hypothetical protein